MFSVFFDKSSPSPHQRKTLNTYMNDRKVLGTVSNMGLMKGSPKTNSGNYSPINAPKCLTPNHQTTKINFLTKSNQGLYVRGGKAIKILKDIGILIKYSTKYEESLGKENIGRTPDSRESQPFHEKKDSSCAGFSSIAEISEEGKGAIHFIPQSKPCNTSKKNSNLVSQSLNKERGELKRKMEFIDYLSLIIKK